jgi:phosphatidate cytidylyltransferase
MALNLQVFQTRALTALVFVAVMLTGLLWNEWSFFILFSIVHFGCWVEYFKMLGMIHLSYKGISAFHRYGVMMAGWCLMIHASGQMLDTAGLHIPDRQILWIFAVLSVLLVVEHLLFKKGEPKSLLISLFGLLYISVSWALLVHLRSGQIWMSESSGNLMGQFSNALGSITSFFIPLVIIASIWINDTMAYIVGSFIGKTPLSPVSPKKTWEGTIGGIILSVAVVTAIAVFAMDGEVWPVAGIALLASVAGTFGDLFESKLKRLAGVKDSGYFMPGHGGFLDRFDSLLLAVPVIWIFCILFM